VSALLGRVQFWGRGGEGREGNVADGRTGCMLSPPRHAQSSEDPTKVFSNGRNSTRGFGVLCASSLDLAWGHRAGRAAVQGQRAAWEQVQCMQSADNIISFVEHSEGCWGSGACVCS